MNTTTATATFTKLRNGSWGIKGHGLVPTAQVTVTKRDGSTSTVIVEKVIWDGGDVQIASIVADRHPRQSAHRAPRGRMACDECGEFVTRGSRCWETGMTH